MDPVILLRNSCWPSSWLSWTPKVTASRGSCECWACGALCSHCFGFGWLMPRCGAILV